VSDVPEDNASSYFKLQYWLGEMPSQFLAIVSCAFLFAMMALTFIDVGGRYLFDSPLPAAYEIVSFIMPGIIFCALPTVNLREGHVTIDLLDSFVPERLVRWQNFTVNLFAGIVLGFISWRLAMRSYDHYRFFEATDELYLTLWYFSAAMAVLCGIAALMFVLNALGYLLGVRERPGQDEVAYE